MAIRLVTLLEFRLLICSDSLKTVFFSYHLIRHVPFDILYFDYQQFKTSKFLNMTERNNSGSHRIINRRSQQITAITSQIMLILGTFILILGLIYMMINLSKSDSIIVIWISLMVTGVALVVMSQLIRVKKEKKNDKKSNIHRYK